MVVTIFAPALEKCRNTIAASFHRGCFVVAGNVAAVDVVVDVVAVVDVE